MTEMKFTIERLGPADLSRAENNCAQFWNMTLAEANLRNYLNDPNCILLAAEVDHAPVGQLVGYILRRWDANKSKLFLYSLDVLESHRRKGIARQLFREFRRIGNEEKCGSVFVLTNENNLPAMKTYQALGGVRTHQDDVMFEWK